MMSSKCDQDVSIFDNLEVGASKPIPVPMEEIHVIISSENLLGGFAKAFVNECYRVNPLLAERANLSEKECEEYFSYLLTQRCLSVIGECKEFRKLKTLVMPSWIQYNISLIGLVVDRNCGLTFIPQMEKPSTMSFEDAAKISLKIAEFEEELQIVRDAMPRSEYGNEDVMGTALIAGYVRSIKEVSHGIFTYVTGFLGLKLREEAAMQVLYRQHYDDIGYIATAILTDRRLFR